MRVGMIGHIYPVPPFGYGGVERVVAWWVDELRTRGHEVTLFADPQSRVQVHKLVPCVGEGERFAPKILAHLNDLDVVHDNNDYGDPQPGRWAKPYIFTVHATVWPKNPNPIFLSYNQARMFKVEAPRVVHNGFPITSFKPQQEKEDFLLWCGSLRGCKAPEMAVQLAQDTGENLKIIGPIQSDEYLDYPRRFPRGGKIEYLGEMGQERLDYFKRAKAFVYTFSDNWVEGFNLVLAEALLSGTPVIGLDLPNNTIVEEVYNDGVGGFWCQSYDEMLTVVKEKKYQDLWYLDCYQEGARHNITNTVDQYLEVYSDAVAGKRW